VIKDLRLWIKEKQKEMEKIARGPSNPL